MPGRVRVFRAPDIEELLAAPTHHRAQRATTSTVPRRAADAVMESSAQVCGMYTDSEDHLSDPCDTSSWKGTSGKRRPCAQWDRHPHRHPVHTLRLNEPHPGLCPRMWESAWAHVPGDEHRLLFLIDPVDVYALEEMEAQARRNRMIESEETLEEIQRGAFLELLQLDYDMEAVAHPQQYREWEVAEAKARLGIDVLEVLYEDEIFEEPSDYDPVWMDDLEFRADMAHDWFLYAEASDHDASDRWRSGCCEQCDRDSQFAFFPPPRRPYIVVDSERRMSDVEWEERELNGAARSMQGSIRIEPMRGPFGHVTHRGHRDGWKSVRAGRQFARHSRYGGDAEATIRRP